jgi:signal transduction histidine kinase
VLDALDVLETLDALDQPAARLAREAERKRIARDLHDGVVQSLTALVADLEYFRARGLLACDERDRQFAEKVETWQALARESLDAMRQALGDLRAPNYAHSSFAQPTDLLNAIETLLARMQHAGYRVDYECAGWPSTLPTAYTAHLYAIINEALTNISRHANATMISLSLCRCGSRLFLSIADDGVGMAQDTSSLQPRGGYHQGLTGMRERAALLGGSMTLESIPARGTRIDIDMPLPGALSGSDS